MSIDRDHGDVTIFCDGADCREEIFVFSRDDAWGEAMGEMSSRGWTKRRVNNDWLHYCSRCSGVEE